MKFLVIFATTFICAQAIQLPFIFTTSLESPESPESPESIEDIRLILSQSPNGLPGVGVVNQPVLQAVKVPRPNKHQIIAQALQNLAAQSGSGLSAQGLTTQNFASQQQQQQQPLSVQGISQQNLSSQTTLQGLLNKQQHQVQEAQRQAVPQSQTQPQGLTLENLFNIQQQPQHLSAQSITLQDLLNLQQQSQTLPTQTVTLQDLLNIQQQPQPITAQGSTHETSTQTQTISSVQSANRPSLSSEPDQILRDQSQPITSAPIVIDKKLPETTEKPTTTAATTTTTLDPDSVKYTVKEDVSASVGVTDAPITIQLLADN